MRSLLLCLALLCACGGGGGGTTPTDPGAVDLSGVWTLRTVNGAPLPFDVPSTAGRVPGDKYQLYYGTLELTPGLGNYGTRDSLRYTSPGGFASVNVSGDDGSVTRSGSTLTLVSGRTAGTFTVTVVGASLHRVRDGAEYVYMR